MTPKGEDERRCVQKLLKSLRATSGESNVIMVGFDNTHDNDASAAAVVCNVTGAELTVLWADNCCNLNLIGMLSALWPLVKDVQPHHMPLSGVGNAAVEKKGRLGPYEVLGYSGTKCLFNPRVFKNTLEAELCSHDDVNYYLTEFKNLSNPILRTRKDGKLLSDPLCIATMLPNGLYAYNKDFVDWMLEWNSDSPVGLDNVNTIERSDMMSVNASNNMGGTTTSTQSGNGQTGSNTKRKRMFGVERRLQNKKHETDSDGNAHCL